MTLTETYMDIVEMLYDYKQVPFLFFLHLLIIGLMGTYLCFLFVKLSYLKKIENNPERDPSKCHDHMKYVDYMREKKKVTDNEVLKLESSEEYQKYLLEKNNPNSKYNRQIEVEEIVLSDESETEMDKARNERKNKSM